MFHEALLFGSFAFTLVAVTILVTHLRHAARPPPASVPWNVAAGPAVTAPTYASALLRSFLLLGPTPADVSPGLAGAESAERGPSDPLDLLLQKSPTEAPQSAPPRRPSSSHAGLEKHP